MRKVAEKEQEARAARIGAEDRSHVVDELQTILDFKFTLTSLMTRTVSTSVFVERMQLLLLRDAV